MFYSFSQSKLTVSESKVTQYYFNCIVVRDHKLLHYQDQQPIGSAFYAFDNSDDVVYNPGDVFPFSVVHLDPGSNFNIGTSTYTCPVAGVYMFR